METHFKKFPFEIRDVKSDLAEELMEHYTGEKTGFVQVGPQKYFFSHQYKKEAASIYNMRIRPDDIFVHTFPRSGTTLTQELVWLVHNDLNYEKAKATKLFTRFPRMEFSLLIHPETEKVLIEENKDCEETLRFINSATTPSAESMESLPSPRFIKTHILTLSLLPPELLDTAKVVYVARDPRDVAVSLYHLYRLLRTINAVKDFKTHWNYFIRELSYWAPYFQQVKEAWNLKNHPNMLFLFYEDMTKNMPAAVRQVATFLGKSYTDQQISELCDHLSFDNFKNNSSVKQEVPIRDFLMRNEQPFIRKGNVGGWRDYFDEEMQQQAKSWMDEGLRDTDLRFPTYDSDSL